MSSKSVEVLLQDLRLVSEARHATVQAVRAAVRRAVEPLSEEVKYGGILFSSGVPFGGVFAYKEHVSVEFSHGAAMGDPFGLLEGEGKLRRHLKLACAEDVEHKRVADHVPLAVQAAKAAA